MNRESPVVSADGKEAEPANDVVRLFDAIPGAIYRRLPDALGGTALLLSAGFCRLTGYPRDHFFAALPHRFVSIVHPDDQLRVVEAIVGALSDGYALDYRIVTADGTSIWVHDQGRITRDDQGVVASLSGVILDISERRKAADDEAKRQASIAQQQQALVQLATASSVAQGRLVEASVLATEALAEACSVARVSVWLLSADRHQLELVDLYRAADGEHHGEATLNAEDYPGYFRALRSGRTVDASDARSDPRTCEFTDGYLIPLDITAMLDAAVRVGGEVVGVVCLEHVGTKRVWLPSEMRFAGEVADQVALTLLSRARRAALDEHEKLLAQVSQTQKLEAVGQLAGGVAHDFNNLLTVISMNAEILLGVHTYSAEHTASLEEILRTTRRASDLTSQLLTFSRQETIEVHAVDVVAVVSGMRRMVGQLVGENRALQISLEDGPIWVTATPSYIQQVVSNLVVNARDATPDGGSVTVEIGTVEATSARSGRCVSIVVRDNGAGMSPMLQSRIFEPFFTTKETGKGTGLGLSTVYGVVERCGGTISVKSQLGVGTEFTALLPAVVSREPSDVPTSPRLADIGQGRVVVLVDDFQPLVRATQQLLKEVGFVVRCANNADEAILLLQPFTQSGASPPALILTDVVMPGGGGLQVRDWARENLPDVPLALMSGYIDDHTERRTRGMARLDKPYTRSELWQFVADQVGAMPASVESDSASGA